MKIIKATKNLHPRAIYKLTMSPETRKMSTAVGQVLELEAYALYEDADKKTGEVRKVLAIGTPEGECFATNSPTFIEEFERAVEFFEDCGETVTAIRVISGVSKSGREYISCTIAD